MTLRTGHGRGAGSPRVEVLPPDEQPQAQAAGTDPLSTGRDPLTKRLRAASGSGHGQVPRATVITRKLACDPRFEPHNRRRLEWQRKRMAELQALTEA